MANPFSLEGKRVLVTGASSGIGRSISVECSKIGAKIILCGRSIERLEETMLLLDGSGHSYIQADLSIQADVEKLVEQVSSISGLVHSAGIPKICPLKYLDRESIEEIFNINTTAPILLTSLLVKKKKIEKKASIVFISSISGVYVANTGESSYAASKAALSGFTKVAAFELAGQGIRVNSVNPGIISTNLLELSNMYFSEEQMKDTMLNRYPMKRLGKPEDVAYGVIYLLSDASSWVTGISLVIDGGYTLL